MQRLDAFELRGSITPAPPPTTKLDEQVALVRRIVELNRLRAPVAAEWRRLAGRRHPDRFLVPPRPVGRAANRRRARQEATLGRMEYRGGSC